MIETNFERYQCYYSLFVDFLSFFGLQQQSIRLKTLASWDSIVYEWESRTAILSDNEMALLYYLLRNKREQLIGGNSPPTFIGELNK